MKISRNVATTTAAMALMLGSLAVTSASAAPTGDTELQRNVAAYKAADPAAKQVDADTLRIPGGTVTLPGRAAANTAAISCANGHLCIRDGNNRYYDYYQCGYYSFSGVGNGEFNNNQTSGTRARFYNSNGSERWSNVAKDSGTASWTPVHYIRPC
ncbi:hypothetical protein OG875_05955 [Streptomyces sp. NBC_01498]|uniref:hypothetical protein n=1 Tax=Streptomyces sp. NBC_01498 TaxID=2975870 RepID=UPI002E7BD7C1|nr:hypothetical protein [Streptomyces sp. NBC_01498]WTL24194.1 hypothetical protein OG875_05955 [Streptomyces sp. NBC_01498]